MGGNVSTLFNPGADSPLTYSLSNNFAGLPSLSSGGVAVTYAVSFAAGVYTLTASAGAETVFTFTLNAGTGAYQFTLVDQLDHATLNGMLGDDTENELTIALGSIIQATDRDGDTVTAAGNGLVITVDDDTPVANADTNTLAIELEALEIENIVAEWNNWDLDPTQSRTEPTQIDQDGDLATDEIRWGTGPMAPPAMALSTMRILATETVLSNQAFSLGTFTHYNNPINGPELDYVTLTVNFVANFNGTLVPVGPIDILFQHNETDNTNDPEASRDIIQITQSTTTIVLDGVEYEVDIIGLVDENGDVVTTGPDVRGPGQQL